MAWLPMYLLSEDVKLLNDWLNREDEIAFLVSNGEKKWIARKEHDITASVGKQLFSNRHTFTIPDFAEYHLWHIPSGPLPLQEAGGGGATLRFQKEDWDKDAKIGNPWSGWTEIRTGANSRVPYFGAGHPGVIHLEINLPHDREIRMSNFGWIGNHYRIIGNGATQTTEKFWNRLKKMAKKTGIRIPRTNHPEGKKEIYAFPAAYEEIKNGRPCSLNP